MIYKLFSFYLTASLDLHFLIQDITAVIAIIKMKLPKMGGKIYINKSFELFTLLAFADEDEDEDRDRD